MNRLVEGMRIERLGHDSASGRRETCQPAQDAPRSCAGAQHSEVLAEEDDGVEHTERNVDRIDREQAGIDYAQLPAARDRSRRRVDADDVEPTLLEMEACATATTSGIEHSASNESHRPPLVGIVPLREGRREIAGVEGHDEAVVSLDNLVRALAGEHIGEQSALDVAGWHGPRVRPRRGWEQV